MWFYVADGTQYGPVALEQLVANLRRFVDPRAIHVWRDGMPDWQLVGSVPAIAARLLPPPVPQTAAPASDAALAPDGETPVALVLAVAALYRRLVLLATGLLVMDIALQRFAFDAPSTAVLVLGLLLLPAVVGVSIGLAVTAYRLMSLLEEGTPMLWAAAMFVPVVNLVALLVISSKSQAWCRKRRIYVGLLGPAQESIDWIRRG
jgi:hypothetical protein